MRGQSASGRPIISQIISSGSLAATSSTNSYPPRSATSLTMRSARLSIVSTSWLTIRGVKPRLTSCWYRWCLGGSMLRMVRRSCAIASSVWSSMKVLPRSEE